MRPFAKYGLALVLTASSVGCQTTREVRYVYQDGDYGVVGLPENTDRWPTHYRRHAEKLMDDHFPEGHEIVRAEEVVEGERTVKVEEARTAEVAPGLPNKLLDVAKIGRTENVTRADTLKLKECRIVYRRTGGEPKEVGYAEAASLTPTQYIDPNAAERHKPEGAKATPADARAADWAPG